MTHRWEVRRVAWGESLAAVLSQAETEGWDVFSAQHIGDGRWVVVLRRPEGGV